MSDERYYEQVAHELQSGPVYAGMWTKAFADAKGNESEAKALYIKRRVAELKAERKTAERLRIQEEKQRERELRMRERDAKARAEEARGTPQPQPEMPANPGGELGRALLLAVFVILLAVGLFFLLIKLS